MEWINNIIEGGATTLGVVIVIGMLAAAAWYMVARRRHVEGLRARVLGELTLPEKVKKVLSSALTSDNAEVAAIGTVTLVDVAWHYTMAAPATWDHIGAWGHDHLVDAVTNMEVLQESLGSAASRIGDAVLGFLHHLEAVTVFGELSGAVDGLAGAPVIMLDGGGDTVVGSITDGVSGLDAAHDVQGAGGLLLHIPLITIGFAGYRAWRRSQGGTSLARNAEYATVEVVTRTGGGLVGGQLGGAVGSLVVPGPGTIIGGTLGAVAGAIGGALLGESVKKARLTKAAQELEQALTDLGQHYLGYPHAFQRLGSVFTSHEHTLRENLRAAEKRLRRARLSWRSVWPDETLILLEETVLLGEERLEAAGIRTAEAVDRLSVMRDRKQYREMGVILWGDPALCDLLTCDAALITRVTNTNERVHDEIGQLGSASLPAS